MENGNQEDTAKAADNDNSHGISFGWLFSIIISVHFLSVLILRLIGNSMYPFFIAVYFWIAAYIVFLAVVVSKSSDRSIRLRLGLQPYQYLIFILGIAAAFRLAFLGSDISISLDPQWYLDFGKFMMQGKMPYADFYFPYPPVFAYFIYPISLLYPSVDAFRLLATLFDILIVGVLWRFVTRESQKSPLDVVPLAYALFPLSVIESGVNGHFEPISNLFLLLAIILVMDARAKEGGALLGLSVATKIYAVFILPVLLPLLKSWRERLELIVSAIVIGILTFVPFAIPVWLRGDIIFPGTSVPGSAHSGFLGSLFDAIPATNTFELGLTILVGIGILVICSLLVTYLSKRISIPKAFTYDTATILLGFVFLLMAVIAAVYPLTTASLMVFWRYPADIGIVRGILTVIGASLIIGTAWKRWRNEAQRELSIKQVVVLISTTVLILATLFIDVFYGWYLLWCIPPLVLLRDRKIILATVVCLLVIYPSYTHDNFASLGFQEDRIWGDEFDSVESWDSNIIVNETFLHSNLSVSTYSEDGWGLFSVDASTIENQSRLKEARVVWRRSVNVYVNPQDEFVTRVSVNWDPTFERYADVAVNFTGYDAEGKAVNGTLFPRNYSPTNLTSVLWRRSLFRLRNVTFPVRIDEIWLIVYPLMTENIMVSIDTVYLTKYHRIHQLSFVLIPLLLIPNVLAVYLLHEYAFKEKEKRIID